MCPCNFYVIANAAFKEIEAFHDYPSKTKDRIIYEIVEEKFNENGYTIITDNWKCLRKDNKYDFVLFGKGMFSNIK